MLYIVNSNIEYLNRMYGMVDNQLNKHTSLLTINSIWHRV